MLTPKLLKPIPDVIFDLDDFCDHGWDGRGSRFDVLEQLKILFPQLRVTLFTIPGLSTPKFLRDIASLNWVELAVHGYSHVPNTECLEWSEDQAHDRLAEVEQWECFVKGFKPPGWCINHETLSALAKRGYWVACHKEPNRVRAKNIGLRVYFITDHPWSVHGHMQPINQPLPALRNGLEQLISERGLPWHESTKFHFVSEVVA